MLNKYLKGVRDLCTPEFLGAMVFFTMAEGRDTFYIYTILGTACMVAVLIELVITIRGDK